MNDADRLDRDALYLTVAALFAKRSTCPRGHVGAVIVRDGRIVSTGYNGAPPGMPHCLDVGCAGAVYDTLPEPGTAKPHKASVHVAMEPRWPNGCTRTTHAEANAVAFAARHGIPCAHGTMYCTHSTCVQCAHILASAGITRMVYSKPYRLIQGSELLETLGIGVEHYNWKDAYGRSGPYLYEEENTSSEAKDPDHSRVSGT